MDKLSISKILKDLNLNPCDVANIYNYGSWTYGTNSENSDRDLMLVVRNSNQSPLIFRNDYDYFHNFELHKLENKYDICIHSVENFEVLLEKNYLLAVECLFLPDEFKLKEEIDFKKIYLEKYYDLKRIKLAGLYENFVGLSAYESVDFVGTQQRSSIYDKDPDRRNFLFKNLFHGLRFLNFAEQLIRTRSIYDFHRATEHYHKMKEIRGDPDLEENLSKFVQYWKDETEKIKEKIEEILPSKVVKGTFESHVTFECSHNTEQTIEQLKKICENTKFKLIFIELESNREKRTFNQLMTSAYHTGIFPEIVKDIENEVYQMFKDFNIIRVKIESLASNEGVPTFDFEKNALWDSESNYFEFHYSVIVKKSRKLNQFDQLKKICSLFYRSYLHLSRNAFKHLNEKESNYMITMRLFREGRTNAFLMNEEVIKHLTENKFPPIKVVREFVVYDNHIGLDKDWN